MSRQAACAARTFIETYFPTESCVYAERDRDDGRREYEVRLSNGAEIKFDAQGQWFEVDCKFSLLPAGIVPQTIAARYRPRAIPARRPIRSNVRWAATRFPSAAGWS